MLISKILIVAFAWFLLDMTRILVGPFSHQNLTFIKNFEKKISSFIFVFLSALVKAFLLCATFILIYPLLIETKRIAFILFFSIILFIKIIPKIIDTFLKFNYPKKLILSESFITTLEYFLITLLITFLLF